LLSAYWHYAPSVEHVCPSLYWLLLEPRLGTTRFVGAYILTGIAASITSLWWHDLTISAGASGAIFGMYGVFLAMLTTNLIEKSARKALLTSIGVFVLYNLVNGLKGGIDNAAHIGGLASGLIVGYAFYPSLKQPEAKRLQYSSLSLIAILILASSFFVFKQIPNDIGKYDQKMKSFGNMENMALAVYRLPEILQLRLTCQKSKTEAFIIGTKISAC
jgi:rhomboid protease GluP